MISTTNHRKPLLRLALRCSLPVLTKELRSRMRGVRAPALLFACTALILLAALFVLLTTWNDVAHASVRSMAEAGKQLFSTLVFLEAALCALVYAVQQLDRLRASK